MKLSFISRRMFRATLVALAVCGVVSLPVAAQEQTDASPESFRNESPIVPKVVTNDFFGSSRTSPSAAMERKTNSPAAAPTPRATDSAPSSVKLSETTSRRTEPQATPSEIPVLPQYEMTAKRDENGNWILVSRRLPDAPTASLVETPPSFASLKISTGNLELDQTVQEMSAKYGVDPRLIVEVIRQESGFRQYAVSSAGAKGLMQLIPATAARMGTKDIFDVRQNVEGGVKYLRMLLDMFDGNVHLALAGYNAGEGRVIRSGRQVPAIPETQNYVRSIMARYNRGGVATPVQAKPQPSPDQKQPVAKPNAAPPQAPPLRVEQRDGVPLLTNH